MTLRRSFVQLLPCNGGHNRLVGSALGSLFCLTQHCVLNPSVADGVFFFFFLSWGYDRSLHHSLSDESINLNPVCANEHNFARTPKILTFMP